MNNILAKIELFIKNNFSSLHEFHIYSLVKKSFFSLSIRGSGALFLFFTFSYISHLLTLDEFGIFSYIFYIIPVFSAAYNFGLSISIMKNTAQYVRNNTLDLLRGFFLVSLVLIAIMGVGCFVFIEVVLRVFDLQNSIIIKFQGYICFTAIFYSLLQIFQSYFKSKMQVASAQAYEQIMIPLSLLLLCFLLRNSLDVPRILFIYQSLYILCSVYLFRFIWHDLFSKEKKIRFNIKFWMKSTSTIYILNILVLILNRLDIIYLGSILGQSEGLGKYTVIFRISNLIFLIQSGINIIAEPLIFASNSNTILQNRIKVFTTIYCAISIVFIIFIYFTKDLFFIMFNLNSAGLLPLLMIVCICQSFNFINGFYLSIIYKLNLHHLIASIVLFIIIIMLTLYKFFFEYFGLIGIGCISMCGIIVVNIVSAVLVRKKLRNHDVIR